MSQAPPPPDLSVDDVLRHPAFGFATVEDRDETGVTLRWERQGPSHPVHVRTSALAPAYRRCLPDGLLARTLREPDEARDSFERDPLGALALLLAEVDGPLSAEDLRDWLVGRRLLAAPRFDGWWDAVRPLVEQDPRFALTPAGLALGAGAGDVLRPDAGPLPPPGSLPAASAFTFGLRLASALTDVHAAGLGIVPDRGAVSMVAGAARFRTRGAPTAAGRADDVRFVARLVLEQVVGRLPPSGDLPESDIVSLLAGLPATLPPELLAVVTDAFAADPALRPADGFALWERLRVAEATAGMRRHAPWAHQAAVCAGFDTHVGLLKSLQSQTNQDTLLLAGEPTWSLLGVFDGISTSNAGSGDIAAGLTARALRSWWGEQADTLRDAEPARVLAGLEAGLARANTLVCDAALRLAGPDVDDFVPMGTTAVIAATRGNRVHLAALGDSRAYLVGRHGAALLTWDQNLQAHRLREALAGRPVGWPDAGSPLTGYVGHFTPDGVPTPARPFTRTITLLPGEWLVLATDGLSDYAAPEEAAVAQLLEAAIRDAKGGTRAAKAMDLCRSLVSAANRGGGGDNVTVVALTLSSEYGAPPTVGSVPS